MDLEKANEYIDSFAKVMGSCAPDWKKGGRLKTGVDLGTANICIAVVDEHNVPVSGEIFAAQVVKDGLVVDYMGSIQIVKRLKARIEDRLGVRLENAAAAIPPGTLGKNAQAVSNVTRAAGFEVTNVVDEPTAAAAALGVSDGAVVDIGGGTTGISILKDGKVISVYDEATGGTHITLVVAGRYGISFDEAEKMKLNAANHGELFPIIRPVAEKMGMIVKNFVKDYDVGTVYLVGGACGFDGFEDVIEGECGIPTVKPSHGLLITPLGIAMHGKQV
jgi:ethanolamine utilization protein EutJ